MHREAERNYAEVAVALTAIIEHAARALAGTGRTQLTCQRRAVRRSTGSPALGGGSVDRAAGAVTARRDGADGSCWRTATSGSTIDAGGLLVSLRDLARRPRS